MINSNALLMHLKDFEQLPVAVRPREITVSSIQSYISELPKLCQYYVKEACLVEPNQLKLDANARFVISHNIFSSGNSLFSIALEAIKVYPDGEKWDLSDFIGMLDLMSFDAALFVFSLYYQKHKTNPSFTADLKHFLDQQDIRSDRPFIKHFYNMSRLASISKVNELSYTDIVSAFDRKVPSQTDSMA